MTEVSDLKDRVVIKGHNNNTLTLKDLKENDVGNYTCVLTIGSARYQDSVALATASSAKWGVRVTKNTNVVEGEKLTLKCEVRGDLTLQWWYSKSEVGEFSPIALGGGCGTRRMSGWALAVCYMGCGWQSGFPP